MTELVVDVTNPQEVLEFLRGQTLVTREVVNDTIADVTFEASRLAKSHARSSTKSPKLITGRYFNSIHPVIDRALKIMTGAIASNVSYAPVIEEGSNPHFIFPKNKKGLFWKGLNHPVKKVFHPGTKGYQVLTGAAKKALDNLEDFADKNFKRRFK